MFERRQRATESLNFTQLQRRLKADESLPALPGLAAQLMACQTERKRQHVENIEPTDEMNIWADQDVDLDD
ncbi:MAG TPA: hypothetical protein VLC92_12100 [Rhodocyclaceae bacterium]|nr:hypothetical protein [Rhodocyclaceae bacterium]